MMDKLMNLLSDRFGFQPVEGREGVISRTWTREAEVAFHGTQLDTYSVAVRWINEDTVRVFFFRNGIPYKNKFYSGSSARALNAIRETVEYAGYGMEVA